MNNSFAVTNTVKLGYLGSGSQNCGRTPAIFNYGTTSAVLEGSGLSPGGMPTYNASGVNFTVGQTASGWPVFTCFTMQGYTGYVADYCACESLAFPFSIRPKRGLLYPKMDVGGRRSLKLIYSRQTSVLNK